MDFCTTLEYFIIILYMNMDIRKKKQVREEFIFIIMLYHTNILDEEDFFALTLFGVFLLLPIFYDSLHYRH